MYAEIPLASPYSVTPGAVPASLLAGQFAVNLPDRRIFAGGEDGLPRVIYDPVAPQIINLGTGQPGLTLQSGNATGGMSDTAPALRLAGASAGEGWDWRYLTNGDLQQVRRVGGVETVALEMRRTGAITLGGVFGTGFMVQTAATNPNGLRFLTASSGNDPQFQVFSPDADRGMRLVLKGASGFSVAAQQASYRSLFTVNAPANVANGLDIYGAATGGRVLLSTGGLDANVPLHIVTTGTGEITLGGGRPAWSPTVVIGTGLATTDQLRIDGSNGSAPVTLAAVSANLNATLRLTGQGIGGVRIDGPIGFGAAPIARQTIEGSRSDGSALAALLSALQARGDITDATTA